MNLMNPLQMSNLITNDHLEWTTFTYYRLCSGVRSGLCYPGQGLDIYGGGEIHLQLHATMSSFLRTGKKVRKGSEDVLWE